MNMIGIKREVFRFSVEGKMTEAMVGEPGEAIRPAIVAADNIEIDLSQVFEVDFAGHSKPVAELAESYGMSGFLDAGSE